MLIATFNVNSVRQRIEALCRWLQERQPDIVCLQEIKCEDHAFPREAIEALGYNVAVFGQKTFNGVAILSKLPFEVSMRGLPGDEADMQARYLEAVVSHANGALRVASIYLPNGNPIGTDKFTYKLAWMKRLKKHVSHLLAYEEPLVLAGDYNVIPQDIDCRDPNAWRQDALAQPESRQAFRALIHLGLSDGLRSVSEAPELYTFWDYQAGAWQRNNGIRIDHILLSAPAVDRLRGVRIERSLREQDKPSDHVPVMVDLALS